ncbi:MAG: hypothetical protein HYV63_24490 [Candidatus Schekmanbacteria bacterium]|nr:hypothetical protein [Candidatus Schekmanbacteria bacterium]
MRSEGREGLDALRVSRQPFVGAFWHDEMLGVLAAHARAGDRIRRTYSGNCRRFAAVMRSSALAKLVTEEAPQ